MYRTVQPPFRLYEQIVAQIEASVVSGTLKPGDQLPPERELAESFGVSRTAVREAIKTLREKGLVEAFPGRGTFITNDTTQNMRESLARIARSAETEGLEHLVEVREILEPEIAARAAARSESADLIALRETVVAMEATLGNGDAFIEADLDFHLALAEASGNPIFLTLIDSIVALLREQRSRISFVPGGPEHGQFHHKRILAAVEAGDADGARQAMRDHMKQVRDDSEAGARIQAGAASA
jgi:GntR family transcriptional repressor for pyruvate dehydrogenase complex